MTKIALIHAVLPAMAPVEDAFKRLWPETRRTNLLDDSLSADREAAGHLTPELSARMMALAAYAAGTGADAVLFTCSAFGEAIDAAARALPIPVLKPNEAMFESAFEAGLAIGMLATFAPAVSSMEDEFRDMARRRGSAATLETSLAPGARAALTAGDIAEHDRLVADAAPRLAHCDAILLAHFSMATAQERVQAQVRCPVLAAPSSAVLKLRSTLRSGAAR
jgi:aspartate/glutamate racemase